MARNYIVVFYQYSSVNEINSPTYISPSDGNATSLLDHTWRNLNSPRGSYVGFPALSDHQAMCVVFRVEHDSPPKSIRFREYTEANVERFFSKY